MLGTIDSQRFEDIADAIREKLGTTDEWKPSQMPAAIRSIDGGYEPVKIVSWAEGSNTDIAAMIDGARRGIIDLHDYWTVGDERVVSLTAMPDTMTGESHVAQSIVLVLMDADCTGFTYNEADNNGNTTPKFMVGIKGVLNNGTSYESGYINASSSNSGGWKDSDRRTWCNEMLFQSLPIYIQTSFREFKWKTGKGGDNTGGLNETIDFLGLYPEKVIMGTNTIYAQADESALYTQWEYYKNASNRIKYVNNSAAGYWTASTPSGTSGMWVYIGGTGTPRTISPNAVAAITAFGCI